MYNICLISFIADLEYNFEYNKNNGVLLWSETPKDSDASILRKLFFQ